MTLEGGIRLKQKFKTWEKTQSHGLRIQFPHEIAILKYRRFLDKSQISYCYRTTSLNFVVSHIHA